MTWRFGGALGGTRTPSLLIRSQMLYPLSYERLCRNSLRQHAPRPYAADLPVRNPDSPCRPSGPPRRRAATCGVIAVKGRGP